MKRDPGVPTALPRIVAGLLVAAVTCASVVPARRATRTSPAEVMRSE